MKIVIPLMCRSKKNSEQIFINKKTHKPFVSQSELYKEFERNCAYFLNKYQSNISYPINLKCTFYVKDKRKRDIVNLLNAMQDILVKYNVIADDNYNIVQSVDGSRIIYEKGREETIIEIEEIKNE
jgi:Holliday junction resolvase RusA-like endonuclease